MKVLEGNLNGKGLKFGIVVGRFNHFISERLLEGAMDALCRHEVAEEDVVVAYCPGAFEIPLLAQRLSRREDLDAVICLGAIIRGGTSHYDLVCHEAAKGIANVSLAENKPIIFGVITTDTIEQAIERAGTKSGNKGFDAAMAALEMCNLLRKIDHVE